MPNDKFTKVDLEEAVIDLSLLRYFPSEPGTQAALIRLLAKMCPHKQALTWLVDTMVNRVGEWKGPAELRGILCWKFKPADGIEAESVTPGFRGEDGEQQSLERHQQLKADGWIGQDVERRKEISPSEDPAMARMIRDLSARKRLQ